MLFNEPKLLKSTARRGISRSSSSFSALQRAEIAEIQRRAALYRADRTVSVLFNEPKLLKFRGNDAADGVNEVSVLFNEPKLLKFRPRHPTPRGDGAFQCSSTSRNC